MKFFVSRKEQPCSMCTATIMPNDEMVITFTKKGVSSEGKSILEMKRFHVACYQTWWNLEFVDKWDSWRVTKSLRPEKKRRTKPKEKLGRPGLYIHPLVAVRLRSLISYHKKANHPEKVLELLLKLEELKKIPKDEFTAYMEQRHRERQLALEKVNQQSNQSSIDNTEELSA